MPNGVSITKRKKERKKKKITKKFQTGSIYVFIAFDIIFRLITTYSVEKKKLRSVLVLHAHVNMHTCGTKKKIEKERKKGGEKKIIRKKDTGFMGVEGSEPSSPRFYFFLLFLSTLVLRFFQVNSRL